MVAITMEEARDRIIENIDIQQKTEECSIYQAAGRIVSRQYVANMNQPPFDRSPLDGFALNHEDVSEAGELHPVTLKITHTIYAGDDYRVTLYRGDAARIMTGAGIPKGADCVIRQEDVIFDEEKVTIRNAMKARANICNRGEDTAVGDVLIQRGEVLTPSYGAVLAGQGYFEIEVYQPLKVGVLATGSELTEQPLRPGQIYNSNAPMLAMRLEQLGMVTRCDYCSDEIEIITDRIQGMLEICDVVITTGGVSVGDKDYLPQVVDMLHGKLLFHGVAMKPGSPMMAATIQNKLLICLSGNPFAAMATLELIALPGLLKASGRTRYYPSIRTARLKNAFPKSSKAGRRFIRARYEEGTVSIPDNHSSGSIASMIDCNCLVDIAEGSGSLPIGEAVRCVMTINDDAALATETGNIEKKIPVYCISGSKNVGKTTVLEQLVKILTDKGYRIGVVKHDGHDFIPDVPATDSFRMREAGAAAVAVYSSERILMYRQCDTKLLPELVVKELRQFVDDKVDMILVEGWKNSTYPKIEIMREAISTDRVATSPVCAICSDSLSIIRQDREQKCPVYSFDEVALLAELLMEQLTD